MSASVERIDDQAFNSYAHPKRKRRFCLALFFATLLFPLIAAALIFGTLVLIVPLFALMIWLSMRVFFARMVGNSVLVSELNYPRIHAIAGEMKQRLGFDKTVYVFVYEEGRFNAYLSHLFFRRAIFLNSEIVEKGVSDDEVRWLVGRFVGYLRTRKQAGVLGWLIRAAQYLLVFNLFLMPYERSMVSTGDRLALAAIKGDVSSAISALQKTLVGRQLGYSLNPEGLIAQHRMIKGTFFGFLARISSSFPHTTARYVDMIAFARIFFPEQYARFLAANAAMPDDLLTLADLEDKRPEAGQADGGMTAGWVTAGATIAGIAGLAFLVVGELRDPYESSYTDYSAYDTSYPESSSVPVDPLYDSSQAETPAVDYTAEAAGSSTTEVASTMEPGIASREPEALAAGYEVDLAWSEMTVSRGDEGYVDIDAQLDQSYLILARGAEGCDVNAVASEDLRDVSPDADATLQFGISEAGRIRVTLPVESGRDRCVIGLGVYRIASASIPEAE